MRKFVPAFVAGLLYTTLPSELSAQQNIRPEPLGLPPAEFPLASSVIDGHVAANDTAALRAHAWKLWAGLTARSTQSYRGQPLPIWETWLSEVEAFSTLAAPAAAGEERILRPFSPLRQLRHEFLNAPQGLSLQLATDADRTRLLAFVKLSPDAAGFVAAQHPMPDNSGGTVRYNRRADLLKLNNYFDKVGAEVADRKILDFPAAAVDLKIVFLPVKAKGLTAIPIWDEPGSSSNPNNPTVDTWTKCVAVDPTNNGSGQTKIDCNGTQIDAQVVGIDRFYAIELDSARAAVVSASLGLSGPAALEAGDYQVAVAMHVTTKEIANWTWQTFWWQDGKDPPNKFPGSVDDMPDSNTVVGPWRNYAMCIADSIVVPANDRNGKPIVCFNPYLEPGLSEGTSSNCMSCHARATVPGVPYPLTYRPNGWIDPGDQLFAGQTKTDFVWAMQNSAR
ncbi:hypothetical protein H8B02_36665 [Bradyrhizobium sp. Pear77]|uniref:hypothetical protein n=1 Tax=Bradyrhizobium altum TaxID=1571202 RepID=UPI001E2B2468|nr:hypothetical protein [Bradyrhizobium altum]MCC8958754.1 hypothetical protein [Bradyrhizobium altum]